ncbi:MAG TPA: SDR family NAD(P)-dependent oxidoreductase [Mycobacteriales bacterium]|nr:SDR family NAD(P)-dependent oxidoreductase [Mycobacteriales bacterium]HVX70366.1 SDR family NAD(P)-dependent oxidoreductase [Mycobacteriales bacterium]
MARSVLLTGASRGIGRAAVGRLAGEGWNVFAGVRQPADGESLTDEFGAAVTPVVLDVTDAQHIAGLPAQLPGSLDAVVNNAGVVVGGPVEGLPLEDLRHQLEVNVVGQVAVTQAVLPLLRASRGRVVFVSSLSGKIATPMTGAYNASKFALEAIADSLRNELWPWRIDVSVVEPAQTDTDMWRAADDQLEATVAGVAPEQRELYAQHIEGMRRMIPRAQRIAAPPAGVADAIVRALTDRRPRPRYIVGAGPRVQYALAKRMPTTVLDGVLRRQSGITRRY